MVRKGGRPCFLESSLCSEDRPAIEGCCSATHKSDAWDRSRLSNPQHMPARHGRSSHPYAPRPWRPAKDHFEVRGPPASLPCHPQCSKDTAGFYIPRYHFGQEKRGRVEMGKIEHLSIAIKSSQGDNLTQLYWEVTLGTDSVPRLERICSNHKRPIYH